MNHAHAPSLALALAAGLAALVAPGTAPAEDATAPGQSGPEAGQVAFMEACAACHGATARGDGPTAALLTLPVPDLTGLAGRWDGGFDLARTVRLIDGREGLAAHGGPMPMFGGLLTGPAVVIDGPEGSPLSTTAPILAIARWLETRQEDTP